MTVGGGEGGIEVKTWEEGVVVGERRMGEVNL